MVSRFEAAPAVLTAPDTSLELEFVYGYNGRTEHFATKDTNVFPLVSGVGTWNAPWF